MRSLKRAGAAAAGLLLFLTLLGSPPPAGAAGGEAAPFDVAAYRGRVVVVDFWASWCAPCRRSFPWLESMHDKYAADGLVVVGINEDNEAGDAQAFLSQVPVSFRIVHDPEGTLAREFELIAMPSTYVIDRDGQIAARHLGFKTAKTDEYEAVLQRLLAADATAAAGQK